MSYVDQRNAVAHPGEHRARAQQFLQASPRSTGFGAQTLAAGAKAHAKLARQSLCSEDTPHARYEHEASEPGRKSELRRSPRPPDERRGCRAQRPHAVEPAPPAAHLRALPGDERPCVRAGRAQFADDTLEVNAIRKRQGVTFEPASNCIALSRAGEPLKPLDIDGSGGLEALQIEIREVGEQRPRLTEMPCRARDDPRRLRPALAEERKQAVTKEIAIEAFIRVGRILDPDRPRSLAQRRRAARGTPSSGRTRSPLANGAEAGIAARPATPAPRSSCRSSVSAWSSSWWAVTSTSPRRMLAPSAP